MRRLSPLAAALSLAFGLALALPAASGAAGLATAAVGCGGDAYPPSPHATLMASTTMPRLGETIEVSGVAFCANEAIRLTLAGTFVGTAHTDGTGAFDPPVKVTESGKLSLCGTGSSGIPGDSDCLTLTVSAHGTAGGGSHNPSSSGGGGTAFTGVQVLLLCLIAGALIVVGWALAAAGRRKRLAAARN